MSLVPPGPRGTHAVPQDPAAPAGAAMLCGAGGSRAGVGGWVFGGWFVLTAYLQSRIKTPRFALKKSFFLGGGGHQDPLPTTTTSPSPQHQISQKASQTAGGTRGAGPCPPSSAGGGPGRVPWVGAEGGCSSSPPHHHPSTAHSSAPVLRFWRFLPAPQRDFGGVGVGGPAVTPPPTGVAEIQPWGWGSWDPPHTHTLGRGRRLCTSVPGSELGAHDGSRRGN